jgi:hypothetical protein
MRRPEPRAKAADPQEPEPAPKKRRAGKTPAGQIGEEGKATSKPRSPQATDRTQATDRRAKAERPEPKRPEATEKTSREGDPEKKSRTKRSIPSAHPTETREPEGTKGSKSLRAAAAAGEGEREPEKPIERAEKRESIGQIPRNYYHYSIISRKNKYIWRAQRASQGKKLKVPGGQSAARSPPHQPQSAKPRTPEASGKTQATRGDQPTGNCQVTATFARSGRGGGWGGGQVRRCGGTLHRKHR